MLNDKIIWLIVFVGLYWAYCITIGLKGLRLIRTASDYFIAGRRLGMWVFVLAATATSFSGWTVIGHPALVYRDGFAYGFAAFYAIVIPLTGVLFLKRQWILGKRFGYVTPGEMLSDYFQGDLIRLLTVVVAVAVAVPFLAVQLGAAGTLFAVVTDGVVPRAVGMGGLALVMLIYVAAGGLRAVAYVEALQCVLLAAGMVIGGLVVVDAVGGVERLFGLIATHAEATADTAMSYYAIPGPIQLTAGGDGPVGGALWTSAMVLSYLIALMGIQAAPAFSMWAFGSTDPKPFPVQQVWASAFGIGLILVVFGALEGVGGQLMGGNPQLNRSPEMWQAMQDAGTAVPTPAPTDWPAALAPDAAVRRALEQRELVALVGDGPLGAQRAAGDAAVAAALASGDATGLVSATWVRLAVPEAVADDPDSLVPQLLNMVGREMPWLVALIAVCALAAMQTAGAAYLATTGAILTRDLYKRFLVPRASHDAQKRFGRTMVVAVLAAAFVVAATSSDALVLLGGIAVAIAVQMSVALIAICYSPWITGPGATAGLIAGLVGVVMTDSPGLAVLDALGITAWERWPLTIHSAGWGLALNVLVTLAVSAVSGSPRARTHRQRHHAFLAELTAVPVRARPLVPVAWVAAAVWVAVGVGPGAAIGNALFGDPAAPETWLFGVPSIWVWQVLVWLAGVGLLWLLAVKLEMSTVPPGAIEALIDDVADDDLLPLPSDRAR